MPRKRMIDPAFFSDGELGDLPPWIRLFYIGLWTVAEDSGCFIGDAKTLWKLLVAGECITCVDCGATHLITPDDVDLALGTLEGMGKIQSYTAGSNGHPRRYYWLKNFHLHQRIDYPTPPKLPLPEWLSWHGEDEFGHGSKGEEGYKSNRRKWHYEVH